MPIGFIRRLARQSLSSANTAVLEDNWTTQQTATYVPATPAVGAAAWGGTVANLDRVLTATGSGHTVHGALLTFVNKPEANALGQQGSLAGAIVKITPTFPTGSTAALEIWSLQGATWTKRRRVALAGLVRSGETVVLDLTGPVLGTDAVDAYWITLAPDIGSETLTWVVLHLYGICPIDPVTPDCPPGTPPEDCSGPECGVDFESWLCLDPSDEPDPPDDPFVLPGIPVKIPFPLARLGCSLGQGPFNRLVMTFGELPSGGSVTVTVTNGQGIEFAEGTSQMISAPGDLFWTVSVGFPFTPGGGVAVFPTRTAWNPLLGPTYPRVDTSEMVFTFTRELDGSAFAVAGNLLDILTYFWTTGYDLTYLC